MKVEKQNAHESLSKRRLSLPWEVLLLIVLLVTVLGVALRSPVKNFPHQDPYDLRTERAVSDARNRVVTGF